MAKRILALSDLHLGPSTPERNLLFIRFLEKAENSGDEVLILGDLFDLWFGWKHLTFPYQKSLLEKMKEFFEKGLKIDYVEGNRDFGIQQYEGILFRKVYERGCLKNLEGRNLYAEHGDLVNREDKLYRFWRAITKNSLTYFVINHLPARLLLKIATYLEGKLKTTNVKYRLHYPEEHRIRFCNEVLAETQSEVILIGHFHQEREVRLTHDARSVLFYNLPGWETGFRYLVIPMKDREPYFEQLDQ